MARDISHDNIMPAARSLTLLVWTAALGVSPCVAQFRFDPAFGPGDTGPMVRTEGGDWVNEDEVYFHQFSENRAYPLAVNAIFYLMTH